MIRIVHMLPGRVRLRIAAVKRQPGLAARLWTQLMDVAGIKRVKVDSRTGSLLLFYDRSALRSPVFLDAFSAAMGKLFPEHFAPGHLRVTVDLLKGNPESVRKIEQQLAAVGGIHSIEIDADTGTCRLAYDPHVVTTQAFIDDLAQTLHTLFPRLNVRKLMSRAGFRS